MFSHPTGAPYLVRQLVDEFENVYGYSLDPGACRFTTVTALLLAMPNLVTVQDSQLLPPAPGGDELSLARQVGCLFKEEQQRMHLLCYVMFPANRV